MEPGNLMQYERYDDIPVSTFTFVARSNIYFNVNMINSMVETSSESNHIRTIKYSPNVSKKTIHMIKVSYKGEVDPKKTLTPNFLHACTIRYVLPEKDTTVKICNTGTMHITGCKTPDQCYRTIFGMYKIIWTTCPQAIYLKNSDSRVVFNVETVMRNVHFDLGFRINRERFAHFFERNDGFGYIITYDDQFMTGLNIKEPVSETMDVVNELTISCDQPDDAGEANGLPSAGCSYTVCEKAVNVKYKADKMITYILFYSGKVRMSACNINHSRQSYLRFLELVMKHRRVFEDVIIK